MKRFLCVWFPDWPLTRLRRSRLGPQGRRVRPRGSAGPPKAAKTPFALVEAGARGLLIAAANGSARAAGVAPGQRFTDAKARCPDLTSEPVDRAEDDRALAAAGRWMGRVAPIVAVDGREGLMMDITGCAHLYGGEAAMAAEVERLLTRDGLGPCRWGLAGTPGAANALAHAAPGTILDEGAEAGGLADLPVSALRLSEAAETLLRRFGLTRIGQLYSIDRKSLARRFRSAEAADAVLLRLDQALGRRREPLTPLRPPPAYAARLACPEPVFTVEAIEAGLARLAHDLCETLAGLGQGARGFTLLGFRADGGVGETEISLARPGRDPAHLLRLFRERIDRIDPGFGLDGLVLEARRVGAMETGPVALSGDLAASETDDAALAALADRVTAKLGEGAVKVARFQESRLPERAETLAPFVGKTARAPAPPTGPRPIRLFETPERARVLAETPDGPPQRFIWRRVARQVARADGPERIGPEWWRHAAAPETAKSPRGIARDWLAPKLDPRADAALIARIRSDLERPEAGASTRATPRARDYYRVEDVEGRRYWLFREGLYGDGRGGHPQWYVHGLFA